MIIEFIYFQFTRFAIMLIGLIPDYSFDLSVDMSPISSSIAMLRFIIGGSFYDTYVSFLLWSFGILLLFAILRFALKKIPGIS